MNKALGLLMGLLLVGYGCGDDSSGGGGGSVSIDLCQTDPAGTCAGECAFEPPSSVDCTSACANVVTVCDSGCAGQCEGLGDPASCAAACEGTKAQRCTNLIFGCYDNNNTCDGVGNCVLNGG